MTTRLKPLCGLLLSIVLLGAGRVGAGTRPDERAFDPPIAAVQCTAPATVIVPAGKSTALRGRATTVDGLTDRDALRLSCKR